MESNTSVVFGTSDVPLWSTTLGALIEKQAQEYCNRVAVSFPWQGVRITYKQLSKRSLVIAKAVCRAGLLPGDSVGIISGNSYQYIEVFLGAGRIGSQVVVLNNTYTPRELLNAVILSECIILFIAPSVGTRSLDEHIRLLCTSKTNLTQVVLLSEFTVTGNCVKVSDYDTFASNATSDVNDEVAIRQKKVHPEDVLNMQFTSGTTGSPKAAMLTHNNLINNGRLVGAGMMLTPRDIVCCPPPLFHCFGLVMGFLGAFTHGSSIVFPSDQFDANRVLDSIVVEGCTALLGVPTMFVAELEANRAKRKPYKITSVRTGLAAGSPVPLAVMNKLEAEMGIKGMLIAYGMTETSPVTFMTSPEDTQERRLKSIGTVMPHTGAKIIDKKGNIVPRNVRGEICTSGYALQKGYWRNEEKTREVMKLDDKGVLWMHTGDEGVIDEEGYCAVTGRIKDIIIRGGENIFPAEIEERLLAHKSVSEASVVGMPDERYGEIVSCFLRQTETCSRPSQSEIAEWVQQKMGRHKAPKYVWWIGDAGVGSDFPKTGSGKHQKHILRDVGKLLIDRQVRARL